MTRPAIRLAPGEADAPALVLSEPLGFWGGVNAEAGLIIDRRHPEHGARIAGCVLVMPAGRGSSSSSSVLAEAIRRGSGPAAIVLATADPILAVGALVAEALYGLRCPIVVCEIDGFATGERLRIIASGDGPASIEWRSPQGGSSEPPRRRN